MQIVPLALLRAVEEVFKSVAPELPVELAVRELSLQADRAVEAGVRPGTQAMAAGGEETNRAALSLPPVRELVAVVAAVEFLPMLLLQSAAVAVAVLGCLVPAQAVRRG